MLADNLKFIAKVRGLKQSDLARAAGVSRQAVSKWMKARPGAEVALRSGHLHRLATELDLDMADFFEPLPETRHLETALLWDGLYSDLVSLLVACLDGQGRALARMVQVYGLLVARKLFGSKVCASFPEYARHIHPMRREENERIWKILCDPT